jgi:hypothetical protein
VDGKELSSRSEERTVSNVNHTDAAEGFVDQTGTASGVICPECGSDHPRRLQRKGFLQTRIYPLFGYYPWVCGGCKTTFLMRKRHRRKSRRKEEYVEQDGEMKG